MADPRSQNPSNLSRRAAPVVPIGNAGGPPSLGELIGQYRRRKIDTEAILIRAGRREPDAAAAAEAVKAELDDLARRIAACALATWPDVQMALIFLEELAGERLGADDPLRAIAAGPACAVEKLLAREWRSVADGLEELTLLVAPIDELIHLARARVRDHEGAVLLAEETMQSLLLTVAGAVNEASDRGGLTSSEPRDREDNRLRLLVALAGLLRLLEAGEALAPPASPAGK